jgi:hypothetical protein
MAGRTHGASVGVLSVIYDTPPPPPGQKLVWGGHMGASGREDLKRLKMLYWGGGGRVDYTPRSFVESQICTYVKDQV